MSDYDFRPGGSLKLKGGDASKKKKKPKTKESMKDTLLKGKARDSAVLDEPAEEDEPPLEDSCPKEDNKTEAERRFEDRQRRMLERKVQQMAKKTHKDRVHEFNAKLETLSEHHDIPKVGPG